MSEIRAQLIAHAEYVEKGGKYSGLLRPTYLETIRLLRAAAEALDAADVRISQLESYFDVVASASREAPPPASTRMCDPAKYRLGPIVYDGRGGAMRSIYRGDGATASIAMLYDTSLSAELEQIFQEVASMPDLLAACSDALGTITHAPELAGVLHTWPIAQTIDRLRSVITKAKCHLPLPPVPERRQPTNNMLASVDNATGTDRPTETRPRDLYQERT